VIYFYVATHLIYTQNLNRY